MEVLLKGVQRLGFNLGEGQLLLFQRYFQELVEGNKRINLTSITDPRQVQTKHFLDSLAVSLVVPEEVLTTGRLVDVGSGAGFPGLPLKIMWPGLRVTLVESVGKKAGFLRHLVDTLGLDDVTVCSQRAESLAHEPGAREAFDVVLSRAVADLSTLAELTLPLCKLGGKVVAQKKSGIEDELRRSERAISLLGGVLENIETVDIEETEGPRLLVVLTKNAKTPSRYPRRPGIPAKRPL